MLEEQILIDKIEIIKDTIQVRELINILKDGQIIASSFKRYMIKKEDDITKYDFKIQNIAKAIWVNENLNIDDEDGKIEI